MPCNKLMLVKPKAFGFNAETAKSNAFQHDLAGFTSRQVSELAILEFENYCRILDEHSIATWVVEDSEHPKKPDAIFPNNWFVTLPGKQLFTFPLEAKNRRHERREDLLELLRDDGYTIDRQLEAYEEKGLYLEGTGSMVIDHNERLIFAARSSRTSEEVLKNFTDLSGYDFFLFDTEPIAHLPIYHTNVMLSIGGDCCVLCMNAVKKEYRGELVRHLKGKTIIEISTDQMAKSFLGNCLVVKNTQDEKFLILSSAAFHALNPSQRKAVETLNIRLLPIPLNIIEAIGGGSARCMLAELF